MCFRFLLLVGFLFFSQVRGEDPISEPERPAVSKIGEHRYRVGEIEFDSRSREVFVPVTVNMREGGPIEYLLVRDTGKVHESIFTTTVSPWNLQIAMKLLKYDSGHGDVFNSLLAPESIEKEGGKREDRGAAVDFFFVASGGEELDAADLVIDGVNGDPMGNGGWAFTGSVVENGDFLAENEGSLIAIYLDSLAIFNMTREGADNDERWGANDKLTPEIGTQGVLIVRPRENGVTDEAP